MELQDVAINENKPLLFGKVLSEGLEETVECSYVAGGSTHTAELHVNVQGDRKNTQSIVTFHDIGMNYISNFGTLFNSEAMETIRQRFCIYHINAPGMEDNAKQLPASFVYPSMENLADMMPKIFEKFGLKSAVCMGCGAGANIFIRFALKNPNRVDGLVAVNATITAVGNLSWIGEKIANFGTPLHEQMMNYHFSKQEAERANHDLVEAHRKHFQNGINHHNMHVFVKEFEKRDQVALERPLGAVTTGGNTLTCQTLLLVGDQSPFLDDVVEVNTRLIPSNTNFLKMADCGGMLMEEQTFKVAEALVFFLQGLGLLSSVAMSRLGKTRTISSSSVGSEGEKSRHRHTAEDHHKQTEQDHKTDADKVKVWKKVSELGAAEHTGQIPVNTEDPSKVTDNQI